VVSKLVSARPRLSRSPPAWAADAAVELHRDAPSRIGDLHVGLKVLGPHRDVVHLARLKSLDVLVKVERLLPMVVSVAKLARSMLRV
jgi:hypothetical protein